MDLPVFKLPFTKCLSVIKYLCTGWSIKREIREDAFCKHKIHSTWNVSGMMQLSLQFCCREVLELKLFFMGLHLCSSELNTFLLVVRLGGFLMPVDGGSRYF